MTIALIVGGILAVVGGVVISVVVVSMVRHIIEWFKMKWAISRLNPWAVAFTLKQAESKDRVRLVQGVFDTQEKRILDHRSFTAERLDDDLADLHRTDALVTYD